MPSARSPQFAVVGEALVDLVDDGGSPYAAHAGGGPLNVAIGLSRLGRPTAFVGRLSRDPIGTVLRDHAARSNVDLSLVVPASQPSTVALVRLDGGVARYQFGVDGTADFQWTDAELDVLPASVRAVHFGSLASWLPPGAAAVDRLVRRLHAAGRVLVSYDPNVRPSLQPDRGAARARVEQSVGAARLVKASEDDLGWLYPDEPVAVVAGRWLSLGPSLLVVTRGADGAVAFVAGREPIVQTVQPVQAAPVVDTVGAGDAFMSGLLDGLARHGALTPAGLRELTPDGLGEVLAHAGLVAAITCSRAGASPPWAGELPVPPSHTPSGEWRLSRPSGDL